MSDLELAVIQAAITYEEAWAAWAQLWRRPYHATDAEVALAKLKAHRALLDAVRALLNQEDANE